MGWKVTLWNAKYREYEIGFRLYCQGRGPRQDFLGCDEVGTVITEIERNQFMDCQPMLSGSRLGVCIWLGTQDPNSIWSKCPNRKIREYNKTMTWITPQLERDKKKFPQWWIDREYYALATPSGGLILRNCVMGEHKFSTKRWGIDVNSSRFYNCVGSNLEKNILYITDIREIKTLKDLTTFVKEQNYLGIPVEVEQNGPGMETTKHLREAGCSVIADTVTEKIKMDRVTNLGSLTKIVFPLKYEMVYKDCVRQIWDEWGKIVKFSDADWFDATWHSFIGGFGIVDLPKTFTPEINYEAIIRGY